MSVGDTKSINVIALPSDTVTDSGLAACGTKLLTFYENNAIVTGYISHDTTTNVITITPTTLSEVGVHTLTLKISLVNYSSISLTHSSTWTVTITGCE